MKRSIKELIGYKVHLKDTKKGSVKDFLFDEESWTLRYMVMEFGNWFTDKKILIPRVFFDKPDFDSSQFFVHVTSDELEKCPKVDEHKPVSRKFEESINKYYNSNNYWLSSYPPTFGAPEMFIPKTNIPENPKTIKDPEKDTSLRSFREVKGYFIECLDEKSGYVNDIIIDDETWKIVYVIVDISDLFEKKKQIMLSVNWITEIDYINQKISIKQTSKALEKSPEFNPSTPINEEIERNVYDYYGKKVVKEL